MIDYLTFTLKHFQQKSFLEKYVFLFLVLFGIFYVPIEGENGFGPIHLLLLVLNVIFFPHSLSNTSHSSKSGSIKGISSRALILGFVYVSLQLFAVSYHPAGFRSSTFFFSFALVGMYITLYSFIYVRRIFTIDFFLEFVVFMIRLYFVVCIFQQICLLFGLHYFPVANLWKILGRGLGCNSLCLEPSMFARFMLVFYYAYVKCNEYKRGKGPFSVKELFSLEHRAVTIPFLWMMLTMGSGTAFVCLLLFALYFIKIRNFYFIIPSFLLLYFVVLPNIQYRPLQRALDVAAASSTMNSGKVMETDDSAASRISPLINSFKVDLSDPDTWFGHGIDSGERSGKTIFEATLFDDYGLLFYLSSLLLAFGCAYRLKSLGSLFMFLGVAGGCGTNIHYAWYLMIIMTCVRYFYENRNSLESSGEDCSDTLLIIDE